MRLVVDTSAIAAVLFDEPDAESVLAVLDEADRPFLSCVNLHEARLVVVRRLGPAGVSALEKLIVRNAMELVSFDPERAREAFEAHVRFGKGRHPARLNLCDCAAYALAKSLDAPLLFKGDDFRRTDVTPAL